LDAQTEFGPTYLYEYSTRDAYGSGINWGSNDPLNATWWHHVTERAPHLYPFHTSLFLIHFFLSPEMEANASLVSVRGFSRLIFAVDQLMLIVEQTFTNFQSRQSVRTIPCNTTQCVNAKICYMRSGSASIAVQNCQSGFGVSVPQS